MNKFSVPYANDNNTFISYNTFSKYFLFLLKCQTTDLVTMTYDGKQKIQMSFVLLYWDNILVNLFFNAPA